MSERSYADDAAAPPPRGTVEVGHLPPQWSPTPPRPQRPLGVAILAFVIAVAGVIVLLSGVFALVNSLLGPVVPISLLVFRSVDPLGAAILLLLGAVTIAIANALWDQERWALWTTIVGTFLAVTYLFFTQSLSVLFLVVLVLFVYLLAVRRYFY